MVSTRNWNSARLLEISAYNRVRRLQENLKNKFRLNSLISPLPALSPTKKKKNVTMQLHFTNDAIITFGNILRFSDFKTLL